MKIIKKENIKKEEIQFLFIYIVITIALVFGLQLSLIPFGETNALFYDLLKLFTQILPILLLFLFQTIFSQCLNRNIILPQMNFLHVITRIEEKKEKKKDEEKEENQILIQDIDSQEQHIKRRKIGKGWIFVSLILMQIIMI